MTTRILVLLAGLGGGAAALASGAQEELDRLAAGEPISVGPDRVVAGMTVALRDSVPGDAMVTGGQVSVRAPVGGDVLAAGGSVGISGPVEGSVRAAGGRVELRSAVSQNVTAAGGEVVLRAGADVSGNAYLAGGSVEVSGPVGGHVLVGGEEVLIDAPVAGNVEVAAERLSLGPGARIEGDLRYRSPNPLERAPGAEVGGTVTRAPVEEPAVPGWIPSVPGWVGSLFGLAAFLFTGLALVAAFPAAAGRLLATSREKPLPSLGVGVLALLLVPLLLVAALITVIGIPLALAGGALFAFALYAARAALALWIGDAMLGDRGGRGRRRAVLAFLAGGALLYLAGLLPWVGPVISVLATAFGLGAAALAARRARRSDSPAAAPGGGAA